VWSFVPHNAGVAQPEVTTHPVENIRALIICHFDFIAPTVTTDSATVVIDIPCPPIDFFDVGVMPLNAHGTVDNPHRRPHAHFATAWTL
jgi:hypothetical protein